MNIYNLVNGKVRCVKNDGGFFTVGNIYEVSDRRLKSDVDGSYWPAGCRNAVEWVEKHTDCKFELVNGVDRVIFNDPATIILWNDGTKTVAKCCDGDKYDAEKGFCIAYLKKMLGTKEFSEELHKWVKDEEKSYKTKPPFNVGDKVKIVGHRNECWNSKGHMDHWMGKVMTIRHYNGDDIYFMHEDTTENGNWGWAWGEEDFARE